MGVTAAAVGVGLGAAGSIASGVMGSSASSKASDAIKGSTYASLALDQAMWQQNMQEYWQNKGMTDFYSGQTRDLLNEYYSGTSDYKNLISNYLSNLQGQTTPINQYIQAGLGGLSDYQKSISDYQTKGIGGYESAVADYQNLMKNPELIKQDPGYQFRLNEALKSIQRGASSKGTGISGATAKSLSDYTSNYASNQLQNALSNYNTAAGLAGNAANLYGSNVGYNQGLANYGTTGISLMNALNSLYGSGVSQYGSAVGNLSNEAGGVQNLASMYGNLANSFSGSGNTYANQATGAYGNYSNALSQNYMNQAGSANNTLSNLGTLAMYGSMGGDNSIFSNLFSGGSNVSSYGYNPSYALTNNEIWNPTPSYFTPNS